MRILTTILFLLVSLISFGQVVESVRYNWNFAGLQKNGLQVATKTDVQNAIDSVVGWARYDDTTYTSANKFVVNQDDSLTLPNDAGFTILEHLPLGVDSFYSPNDTTLIGVNEGDFYTIRVDFNAESSSNSGLFYLVIDIGGSIGTTFEKEFTFPKGIGEEHPFTETFAYYTLDTFLANGGKIKIYSVTGNTSIWDISYVISRTSKGR